MRKIIFVILLLLSYFLGKSQKKIFSYKNEENFSSFPSCSVIAIEANNAFIYSHADKNGIARFFWTNTNLVRLVKQTASTNSLDEGFRKYSVIDYNIIKTYWKNHVIGGLYENRQIIEVIRDKKNADFYFSKTDLVSGRTVFTDTVKSSPSERLIYCFNKLDKLYLLTTRTNSDELIIYTRGIDEPLKKMVDTITLANLDIEATDISVKANHFSDVFKKDEFSVYQNNQRYPATLTSFSYKAYCSSDSVVFTINSDSSICTVILNLRDLSISIKRFVLNFDNTLDIPHKTASYLFKGKLVSCSIIDEALFLQIFDFASGKKLGTVKIDKTNVDSLVAQPVQKSGSFLSKSDVKAGTLSSLINTAINNSLSISCYEENENIYMDFAAPYKQIVNGSTLFNLALTAAGTYAINSAPNYYGFLISTYKGAQTATFVGFGMSVNSSTFSSTRKSGNFSVWDNLNGFVATHPAHGNDRLFFYMNGQFYISDYLPETNTYSIYSFDEKGVD